MQLPFGAISFCAEGIGNSFSFRQGGDVLSELHDLVHCRLEEFSCKAHQVAYEISSCSEHGPKLPFAFPTKHGI